MDSTSLEPIPPQALALVGGAFKSPYEVCSSHVNHLGYMRFGQYSNQDKRTEWELKALKDTCGLPGEQPPPIAALPST